ncbi:hypothetical protein [Pseudomonas sp.]|jgi:hypothetical protein|uniref:hypothetical protein n=1 Tax=Pseudomonas sp. TaxID=306 RepID=UPI00261C20F7|nr:hypothetical protein [Pseudomonas sp.]
MPYPIRMIIALVASVLVSSSALAASAPWYTWQGATRTVCAQNSPGPGWIRLRGPYKKSDCSL